MSEELRRFRSFYSKFFIVSNSFVDLRSLVAPLCRDAVDAAGRQIDDRDRSIEACEFASSHPVSILNLMMCTVRSALKTSEDLLADERARSAEANACAAEVVSRAEFKS
jgi:hypothetical protein